MKLRAPVQRWTSLFLLIAFLHGVLAPSVGLAAGRAELARTVLVQLCGAEGHQLVEIELSDPDAASEAMPSVDHGGLCLLCFHAATPLHTAVRGFVPVAAACIPACWAADSPPYVSALWNTSLARAPPLRA